MKQPNYAAITFLFCYHHSNHFFAFLQILRYWPQTNLKSFVLSIKSFLAYIFQKGLVLILFSFCLLPMKHKSTKCHRMPPHLTHTWSLYFVLVSPPFSSLTFQYFNVSSMFNVILQYILVPLLWLGSQVFRLSHICQGTTKLSFLALNDSTGTHTHPSSTHLSFFFFLHRGNCTLHFLAEMHL